MTTNFQQNMSKFNINSSAPKTVSAGAQPSTLEAPSINCQPSVTIGKGRVSADLLLKACWHASYYIEFHPDAEFRGKHVDLMKMSLRLHNTLLINSDSLQQDSTGAVSVAGEALSMDVLERILFMATMGQIESEAIIAVILYWWITYEIWHPTASPMEFALIAKSWIQAPSRRILAILKAYDAIAE